MFLLNSFLFCGIVCLIAQIILDKTKLTSSYIISLFIAIGAAFDSFGIYDFIIKMVSDASNYKF